MMLTANRRNELGIRNYKYSMGEEQEDLFFIPFKSLCILILSKVLKKVFFCVVLLAASFNPFLLSYYFLFVFCNSETKLK